MHLITVVDLNLALYKFYFLLTYNQKEQNHPNNKIYLFSSCHHSALDTKTKTKSYKCNNSKQTTISLYRMLDCSMKYSGRLRSTHVRLTLTLPSYHKDNSTQSTFLPQKRYAMKTACENINYTYLLNLHISLYFTLR